MKKNYITLDMELSGQKLCAAIKESGYSVKELQEILCLSCPNPIYRWIHGYTLPSTDNLYRLSCILGTPMEELLAVKQIDLEEGLY